MGVSPRPGDQLFFGQVPAELLERAECSVLFVASEPSTSALESRETLAAQEHPASQPHEPLLYHNTIQAISVPSSNTLIEMGFDFVV
jgi:hypothetical protein